MNEHGDGGDADNRREHASVEEPTTPAKPPFYDLLYVMVVSCCVAGITWLFRSGAMQLWDRHPRGGENYEYGWFFSLLFAVPGGFLLGSLLMAQYLMWFQERSTRHGGGHDDHVL